MPKFAKRFTEGEYTIRTDGNVDVFITCVTCNKPYTFTARHDDFLAWLSGKALVQDAMPYVSADYRELLLSGDCGPCYDKLWSNLDGVE